MKQLNQKIDAFCYKHPRFGIPRLMLYIVIGNLVVWLFYMMDTTGTLYSLLYFDPAMFCRGQVWRLVTFALVPEQTGVLWLALSLYFYYFIGTAIEREWGAGKFTIYYFSGLLLTALYSLILYWVTGLRVVVPATYLNLSLFFAFATLWPEQRVLLFFIIPVKIKWLAWVDAAFFVWQIVQYIIHGYLPYAFVPLVAMIAYLVFCGQWLFELFGPRRMRQRARTVQFRQAVHRAESAGRDESNIRRCAVCGKTAAEHPELEFRFCSRCAGYHCFCQEHINNHIHFTE